MYKLTFYKVLLTVLLVIAPISNNIKLSTLAKFRPTFSTDFYTGSAINDKGTEDEGRGIKHRHYKRSINMISIVNEVKEFYIS